MKDRDREDEDNLEFEYTKVDKRAGGADEAEESAGEEPAEEEPVAEAPADEGDADTAEEPAEEELTGETAEAVGGDVAEEDVGEDAAETDEAPEQPATDAEAEAEAAQAMMTDPYQLLRLMVGMLSEAAWANLGLHVSPGAAEAEVKLAEAKVAIDTLAFIRDQLQPTMDEGEKREMENLVSTLQMNYVRRA